jgi:hypothetical protein
MKYHRDINLHKVVLVVDSIVVIKAEEDASLVVEIASVKVIK